MRKYEARVYEIEGKQKFPRMSQFNTSGPGSANGTHILFLTEPETDRTPFGQAVEEIGDPAVYGLLVYAGAISQTTSLIHNYRGTIETEGTLRDITFRLRSDRKDIVTAVIEGGVREYWEALLLQRNSDNDDFQELMKELGLGIW